MKRTIYGTTYPLRLPDPLFAKISKIAKSEKRTIAFMIRELVEQGLIRRAELEAQQ